MQMLKTSIRNLPVDYDAVVRNVTELALDAVVMGLPTSADNAERLQQELNWIQQKKEAAMDAYFSREISKEDMLTMTGKYEQQLNNLRQQLEKTEERKEKNQDLAARRHAIQSVVRAILDGETESEVFCKTLLESLTVFKDRHLELRLNWLPHVFHFAG